MEKITVRTIGHCLLLLLLLTAIWGFMRNHNKLYPKHIVCSFCNGNRIRSKGLGGWDPIGDLKETFLKEVAEFAVSEISKQSNRKLVFQGVLKGERQVVQGFNYLLDIQVKDDESSPHSNIIVMYNCFVYSGILNEGMTFKGCD